MIAARVGIPALFSIVAYAQIGAPQLGLITDGSTVRPVIGIPASAAVGTFISYKTRFAQVVAASTQNFALAVDSDTGSVLLLTIDGASSVLNIAPWPDRIQFSARGSAAVLWYSTDRHLRVISGLPGDPSVSDMSLPVVDSDPTAFTVTDDGQRVAASWLDAAYQLGPYGQVKALPISEAVRAVAFLPGGTDLAAVTPTGAFLLRDSSDPSSLASFATAIQPVAAALDNKQLVIADNNGNVLTVDLVSGSLNTADCQCTPLGLFPMNQSAYRLTGIEDGSFKLFDAQQNSVWFAPVQLEGSAQ